MHVFFPCPRSRLKIYSCGTDSVVPSRVSPLILNIEAESRACSRNSSRHGVNLFIPPTVIGSVPSLPGHAIAHRPPAQGQCYQGSSSNGCCLFSYQHGPILMRLSFPTPTAGTVDTYDTENIVMFKIKGSSYQYVHIFPHQTLEKCGKSCSSSTLFRIFEKRIHTTATIFCTAIKPRVGDEAIFFVAYHR